MPDDFSDFDRKKVNAILNETRSEKWHEKGVWPFRFAKRLLDWGELRNQEEIRRLKASYDLMEAERNRYRTSYSEATLELETMRADRARTGLAIDAALRGVMPANTCGMESRLNQICVLQQRCAALAARITTIEQQG